MALPAARFTRATAADGACRVATAFAVQTDVVRLVRLAHLAPDAGLVNPSALPRLLAVYRAALGRPAVLFLVLGAGVQAAPGVAKQYSELGYNSTISVIGVIKLKGFS